MMRFLWPLVAFLVLAGFLYVGLSLNPREVPSPLIDKPAPNFNLAVLDRQGEMFKPEDMKGQVWMLNVWASWCVSCREEHPVLVELSRQSPVALVGLNYKEVRGDGNLGKNMGIDTNMAPTEEEERLARMRGGRWLVEHGNPYTLTVLDLDGRVGIDYGVYGVPETYVIDKQGIIRYKEIGPITRDKLQSTILPLIAQLQSQT